MQPYVGAPGGFGARGGESVFCGAEVSAKAGVGGFLSLFFLRGGFLRFVVGVFGKEHRVASLSGLLMARARSRPTQTRLTAQQRVALAYGELLPQPRLSVAIIFEIEDF